MRRDLSGSHSMNTAPAMLSKRLGGPCISNKWLFTNGMFLVPLSGEQEEGTCQLYRLPQLCLRLSDLKDYINATVLSKIQTN